MTTHLHHAAPVPLDHFSISLSEAGASMASAKAEIILDGKFLGVVTLKPVGSETGPQTFDFAGHFGGDSAALKHDLVIKFLDPSAQLTLFTNAVNYDGHQHAVAPGQGVGEMMQPSIHLTFQGNQPGVYSAYGA